MKIATALRYAIESIWDSNKRFYVMAHFELTNYMNDEEYLVRMYRSRMNKELNLNNPLTFNEKLQWLKIHNRDQLYTKLVDKYEAKQYVSKNLGEQYIIPTIGLWDSFDEIDFSKLPGEFVLKCTHDSGGVIVCRDKNSIDSTKIRRILNQKLSKNYYWGGREWPYKNVKPRIIAEEYMEDNPNSSELTDYKFHCFNGRVDSVMVCYDRQSNDTKYYFFDKDWQLKRYNYRGINAPKDFTLPKPKNMDEMFFIAEQLSRGLPFVRIDLYSINGKTYFGEITFYPQSGFDNKLLPETDKLWGEMIDLDIVKRTIQNNSNTYL